jgi:glutaminyl-peptide cyclotransferase
MKCKFFKTNAIRSMMIFGFSSLLLIFCHSTSKTNPDKESGINTIIKRDFILVTPAMNQVISLGQMVDFTFKAQNMELSIDSADVYLDGKKIRTEKINGFGFSDNTLFYKVGRQNIRLKIFYGQNKTQSLSTNITILSNQEPKVLKFKVIREIYHDSLSYTQGLIYYKGFIYEGTGLEGRSKIRKIDPANGNLLKERKLDDDYFGEGITILNNKIYQITYSSRVGFVYDLETFELIRKFNMQTTEGWGLTTDGQNLILSDGSSIIYYYDPELFTQINQLDVSDQKRLVDKLNELEYINGSIWANIYGKSQIVKIDSKTGMITAQIDFRSIYPKGIPDSYDYVLNGIAYNPDNDSFFITGKLWPIIYEIKIID